MRVWENSSLAEQGFFRRDEDLFFDGKPIKGLLRISRRVSTLEEFADLLIELRKEFERSKKRVCVAFSYVIFQNGKVTHKTRNLSEVRGFLKRNQT